MLLKFIIYEVFKYLTTVTFHYKDPHYFLHILWSNVHNLNLWIFEWSPFNCYFSCLTNLLLWFPIFFFFSSSFFIFIWHIVNVSSFYYDLRILHQKLCMFIVESTLLSFAHCFPCRNRKNTWILLLSNYLQQYIYTQIFY